MDNQAPAGTPNGYMTELSLMEISESNNAQCPIFVIPRVTTESACLNGLPEALLPKFRHLLHLKTLLRHLWNVQLGQPELRTLENIRAAYGFWCEHGLRNWEGDQFDFSHAWITDALKVTTYKLGVMVCRAKMSYNIDIQLAANTLPRLELEILRLIKQDLWTRPDTYAHLTNILQGVPPRPSIRARRISASQKEADDAATQGSEPRDPDTAMLDVNTASHTPSVPAEDGGLQN
ncbi:hypothetical protein LOZ53_005298 [Ophidiomyces ophidiicola]|nr:hypothetical protein LOZ55_000336 [Ophidiomyces ophidiicola]KAI1984290.1 hypothetical protein LOZ54_004603 [Ophidiomyces ophidiicola]KAI1984806.1 hypothetical protein LOZ53_005298 [Ophidiomyces ophidiicola]KAI1991796.1 hypothetical protein LOZ51_004385 [Ophidiomyces ophidiicola]